MAIANRAAVPQSYLQSPIQNSPSKVNCLNLIDLDGISLRLTPQAQESGSEEELDQKRRKSSPVAHTEVHRLDDARLAELGEKLREKYASVQEEAIPDRLKRLIETLRAQELNETGET